MKDWPYLHSGGHVIKHRLFALQSAAATVIRSRQPGTANLANLQA